MLMKWLIFWISLLMVTECQSINNNELTTPTKSAPTKTVLVRRLLPQITKEPLLAIFLKQGKLILIKLARDGVATINNQDIKIPKGKVLFRLTPEGITSDVTGSQILGNRVHVKVPYVPNIATFETKVFPPFGPPKKLALIGEPEILYDPVSNQIVLVELLGLESYLKGVLPTEINPKWPLEAIKAQAVIARTYTMDRYLRRFEQIWHLHWHFSVDMAYGGMKRLNNRMKVALMQTKGQLLATRGLPIPAFFHACSGGRTQSAINFRPELLGADNVTQVLQVMPSVVDPYAIKGAKNLRMLRTHVNWHTKLSLVTVNVRLKKWMRDHPDDYVPIGTITSVRMGERFRDSGRLKTVIIQHRLEDQELETAFSAGTFRLAVNPGVVRSTDWHSCVLSKNGKSLSIRGRGYGHGVGLSQVSAYQMAREGFSAGNIVRHFYPGAKLVQWWR